jgi:hypothetical protein
MTDLQAWLAAPWLGAPCSAPVRDLARVSVVAAWCQERSPTQRRPAWSGTALMLGALLVALSPRQCPRLQLRVQSPLETPATLQPRGKRCTRTSAAGIALARGPEGEGAGAGEAVVDAEEAGAGAGVEVEAGV